MKPTSDSQASRAPWPHNLLFILGGAYLFTLLMAMTPDTHQLDDAKMMIVYILGPVLTVVYLVLLTMGKIRAPHVGVLLPLLAYVFIVGLSMVLSDPIIGPKARQGMTMQLALLGPFFCFLGALDHPAMYRKGVFLVVAVAFFILFGGYFHRGLPGGRSTVLAVFENIEFERVSKIREATELNQQLQDVRQSRTERYQLSQEIKQLVSENQRTMAGFWRRLLNTLQGARGTMMSWIMNRNFLAGYVIFLLPAVFAAIFLLQGLSGRIIAIFLAALAVVCWVLDSRFGIWRNSLPLWFLEVLGSGGLLALLWHAGTRKLRPASLMAVMTGAIVVLAFSVHFLPDLLFALLVGAGGFGLAFYFFEDKNIRIVLGVGVLLALVSLVGWIGNPRAYYDAEDIVDVQGLAKHLVRGESSGASVLERRVWSFLGGDQQNFVKRVAEEEKVLESRPEQMAEILNGLIAIKQLGKAGRGEAGISVRQAFREWSVTRSREINRKVLDAFCGEAVRAQGWNLHGFWFIVLAVLGGSAFFFAPVFAYRLLFVCAFVILVHMIYLTRSFVANYLLLEIELVLGFFIFLLASRMEKRKAVRLVVALIGLTIIGGCLLLISPKGEEVMSLAGRDMGVSAMREKLNPVTSRYIIFSGAIDIWKRHPIIGAGPMSFMAYFPYFRRPDYFLFEISHVTIFAHNIFLDVLAETGLLGLAAFLTFLGYLGWRALRTMHASPDRTRRLAVAALFLGALGFLLSNMTSPNARWPICAGLFWASLGMVAGVVNRPWKPGQDTVLEWVTIRRPISRVLMLALIGFSALFVIFSSGWCLNYFNAALLNHNGLEFMNMAEANLRNLRQLQQQLEQAPEGSPQRRQLVEQWNNIASNYDSTRLKSMEYFEKSFQTTPLFVTSYYKLGSLYARSNQLQEAKVADLKKAILTFETLRQFAPEFAQVRWNLARVNGQLSSRIDNEEDQATAIESTGKAADVLESVEFNREWLLRQAIEHHRVAAIQSINTNMNEYYIGFMLNQGRNFPSSDFNVSSISDAETVASRILKDRNPAIERLREIGGQQKLENLRERLQDYRSVKGSVGVAQEYDALREAILEVLRPAEESPDLYNEAAFAEVEKSGHLEFLLGLDLTGERMKNRNRILVAETLKRDTRRHPITEFYHRNIRLHPYEEAIREAESDYERWRDILRNDIPVRHAWDDRERSLEEVVMDVALLYVEALQTAGWDEEARAVIEEMLDIIPGNPTLLTYREDLDKLDAMPNKNFPE